MDTIWTACSPILVSALPAATEMAFIPIEIRAEALPALLAPLSMASPSFSVSPWADFSACEVSILASPLMLKSAMCPITSQTGAGTVAQALKS